MHLKNALSYKVKNADYLLIGAGAGLSTSASIEYSGERFEKNFAEFIKKYHFTDMYTSGFYDFETLDIQKQGSLYSTLFYYVIYYIICYYRCYFMLF